MGQLVVVRHGQASMMSADYDVLSERGHAQSRLLGESFAARGVTFDGVFSGPARRHLGTAAGVRKAMVAAGATMAEPTVVPGLDEHDAFGLVMAGAELLADDPQIVGLHKAMGEAQTSRERSAAFARVFEAVMLRWLTGDVAPEGIETWPTFRERVEAGVQSILASATSFGQRLVVFTSAGPLAVMLLTALGTTPARSFETAWRIRNASVTRFVFGRSRGRITLDAFNVIDHLGDPDFHTFA
jgi:broad specificity phosphatase PhoE